MSQKIKFASAGVIAGSVTGILGSGGGMLLVPLLTPLFTENPKSVFPSSLSIMLPICIASLLQSGMLSSLSWTQLFPFLLGGFMGSLAAAHFGSRIPTLWLHRLFGVIALIGGFQCLLGSIS